MEMTQALKRIEEVQQDYGFPGTLETLMYMQDYLDSFDRDTRIAFGVTMEGFRRLLAPA